jgi:hypothetical protein
MKKVIKLTESDLINIVKRVLEEQSVIGAPNYGMTSKTSASPANPIPVSSLNCVPLIFQSAISELIKQNYDKTFLKTALGIIGRESDFGESNRYQAISKLKYFLAKVGIGASVGYGQIKPKTAQQYGVTVDELTTVMGSLSTIYNILKNNYQTAINMGYTSAPSSNFNEGTGNSALDISIAGYNLGVGKITKYCKTSDPNINKPCELSGKVITEQSDSRFETPYNKELMNKPEKQKTIIVTNQVVKNYLPNFKTKRLDGVSISSHGYVKEVALRLKKYNCF